MPADRPHEPSPLARLNAELADRALSRGAGVALHRPVHVYLQIASGCNLDCPMCDEHNRPAAHRHGHGLRSMSPEVFARLEREVLPWAWRLSLGVGGEPTLSEHFVDYVERAAGAGLEVHLTTNGTRFASARVAETVARHVRQVHLSLDAASAETYERIRVGSRWRAMLAGVERLNALRRAAPDGGCRLTLAFVLMRRNVRELPAFVELAHELGAEAVHAQHVIPVTSEGARETLDGEAELYARVRADAQRRAEALGVRLEAPRPFGAPPPAAPVEAPSDGNGTAAAASPAAPLAGYAVPCSHPNQAVHVLFAGRVFPCCHPYAHRKMQIGDLRRQDFAAIWNGRLLRNLRAGLKSGDVPAICRTCSTVHDPPPPEDPERLAGSPDLARHYQERDLDPLAAGDPLAGLRSSGLLEYVLDLRDHAAALERERAGLADHALTLETELPQLRRHLATLERLGTDVCRRGNWLRSPRRTAASLRSLLQALDSQRRDDGTPSNGRGATP